MSSCGFSHSGQVTKQLRSVTFRQWSDKGYVQCHVMLMIHFCDTCGMHSTDDGADKIMDEAFQREYRKLP
jgi:hypothetical protein